MDKRKERHVGVIRDFLATHVEPKLMYSGISTAEMAEVLFEKLEWEDVEIQHEWDELNAAYQWDDEVKNEERKSN